MSNPIEPGVRLMHEGVEYVAATSPDGTCFLGRGIWCAFSTVTPGDAVHHSCHSNIWLTKSDYITYRLTS